jgi:hypothetical protein
MDSSMQDKQFGNLVGLHPAANITREGQNLLILMQSKKQNKT